ncbi:DNA polymerase III alpha subunit [Gracilaria domingensis]|nr:DNA polymerase III alpha subunit [Gracilaria domingensis]
MDFLGLKSLTVIERALEFIRQGRHEQGNDENLEFSVDALPLDDEKTYKLLSEGELDGIFQLDASSGMRNIVRELRPTSLEDISSILALYRPGPLDAGLIPKFIRRKHGLDPIEYDHPLLEPILKETYGIMVYQEQIMRIARDLAGYSLGQADILRRAMGKKKLKDMEKERPRFVKGAEERGISNGSARGAAAHSVRETSEGIIVEDCSRLSNESSSLKTNHKPSDRSQEEGLNTNADKVRERLSTALPTAIEVHRSTGTVDAQRESVVKTRVNADEHHDLSFNEGDDFAWSTSKRAEVINSMKWMPKRDIFSEKVFCAGPRMNDFAPSDAFLRYSEEAKPSLLTASRADEHVRVRLEKILHSTTLDSQVECSSGHQPKIESECFKIGSEDPPENHKLSDAEKKTESHSSFGDIVQSDTFIDSIDETLLSKTSKESSESLLSRYRGLDLKDGMLLDFDSLGFEGLLDAVCLLGGEAARLHTQCECVVAGITGISTSKIVEKNVMLKLIEKPSYVKDKCIYVLIDVREVEPTGGRKRGRSFGPIVVLLISRNKQAPMKTSTKQSQKLIGSTSKCLEKAATIDFDFSRRERKRQYTPQQYLDRSTELQLATDIDGSYETHADCGQILSSMFRIALLCVGRAFEVADEKLHVVAVDSITVSNPAILHGTIVHQSVNAIIFDISLKQVNVQVKSVLSTANGATVQVTAGFMVAHKERHNKFPNVRANDEPLYQHREISECFHGYSRRLRRNGEV